MSCRRRAMERRGESFRDNLFSFHVIGDIALGMEDILSISSDMIGTCTTDLVIDTALQETRSSKMPRSPSNDGDIHGPTEYRKFYICGKGRKKSDGRSHLSLEGISDAH